MVTKVSLKDVVMRVKEKVDKDKTDLVHYVGGEHLDSCEICVSRKGVIDGSTIGPAFHMSFQPGDVLLMSRNPHLKKASVVDFSGVCSDVSYVCRTKNNDILLQEFLPLIFQSDDFWTFAEEHKKGGLPFFLNWSDFERFEFELPNIEIQKKKSEILWGIERARRAFRDLIRQTNELVKSRFIELYGVLEYNTKNYPVRKLRDIASYWNGLTYKPSDVTQNGSGTLVLRSSNIQNGELAFYDNVRVNCPIKERLVVQDNDILMCSRNGSATLVGKTALIRGLHEQMTFGAFMMIIRSDYYSFLKTFFEMPAFRCQISTGTSTINQITGNMLNQIEIPVPTMDIVKRFEVFVEQSDKSKYEIKKSLESLDAIQKALVAEMYQSHN
jgi:type I restriction enzyme S subunit